ncbi:MAG: M28 family metallopeptidase [Methanopyri archaeon]|nr:M28 family metallopeptidase [Methanopyri archaeon]
MLYDRIVDTERLEADLYGLCAVDSMTTGRGEYMADRFEDIGFSVERQPMINYPHTDKLMQDLWNDENVIAEYTGDPGTDKYLLVMGHHDKVPEGKGANDNGSGSVMLLELAHQLVERGEKVNVRFASYGLEEIGLDGASVYVKSLSDTERGNIIAAVNLDCIGAGSELTLTLKDRRSATSEWVNEAIKQKADSMGISYYERASLRGSSDHAVTSNAGIPTASLCRQEDGAIPNLHTKDDVVENIDLGQLTETGDLVYHALIDIYRERSRSD